MAIFRLGFVPHADGVSLAGGARAIEKRLLPDPEYYPEIITRHPGATPFAIQRSILQKWSRPYNEKSDYGEEWYVHLIRFMKMLMPRTVITPWFLDEARTVQTGLAMGRDIINFIGSKSSGKSAFMARVALTLVAVDPDFTICYAAAPYKNAADYTIWGEMENCFKEINEAHPDVYVAMRFLPSLNKAIFSDKKAKAGRVELVGLDRVARLQGAKSENPERGFLLLLADEVAVFQSQAFIEIIANITANMNFLGITGCNFKDALGMEGIICNPQGGEYTDLDKDKDQLWLSDYNSITLRLDGHLCPNVTETARLRAAGELRMPTETDPGEEIVIYPFLLTESKRKTMEDIHGLLGPKYLEQIRSFPNMASGDNYVLSMEQLRSGGAFDDFYERTGRWERVAFCDPGWTGDPCKIGAFEFGPARVQTHDGSSHDTVLIKPLGTIEQLKVEVGKVADVDYLARLDAMSEGQMMLREGREVTMDNQIALQCAEFLARHNIEKRNFGFDASCRGSITQEMVTVVGREIMAYDFQARPTNLTVDVGGAMASDKYRNLRSEMYFLSQLVVLAGQLRGGHEIMDALAQICRHRYNQLGNKVAVEPKDDYKKCNQGKSPDAADVFVGALHVARRRGMRLSFTRSNETAGTVGSFLDLSGLRPRPSVKRLNKRR